MTSTPALADADRAWVDSVAPTAQQTADTWADDAEAWVTSVVPVAQQGVDSWADDAEAWVNTVAPLSQRTVDSFADDAKAWVGSVTPVVRQTYDAWTDDAESWITTVAPTARRTDDARADDAKAWIASVVTVAGQTADTEADDSQATTEKLVNAYNSFKDGLVQGLNAFGQSMTRLFPAATQTDPDGEDDGGDGEGDDQDDSPDSGGDDAQSDPQDSPGQDNVDYATLVEKQQIAGLFDQYVSEVMKAGGQLPSALQELYSLMPGGAPAPGSNPPPFSLQINRPASQQYPSTSGPNAFAKSLETLNIARPELLDYSQINTGSPLLNKFLSMASKNKYAKSAPAFLDALDRARLGDPSFLTQAKFSLALKDVGFWNWIMQKYGPYNPYAQPGIPSGSTPQGMFPKIPNFEASLPSPFGSGNSEGNGTRDFVAGFAKGDPFLGLHYKDTGSLKIPVSRKITISPHGFEAKVQIGAPEDPNAPFPNLP